MRVKARFEGGSFVPMEDVEGVDEGEVLELSISKEGFSWKGSLKQVEEGSVDLQHKIREKW